MPFTVNKCLGFWNTSEFASELEDEIAQNGRYLNLDEYCKHGGSPDAYVEIDALEFVPLDATQIRGSFFITFTESYFNGCRDIDWSEEYHGEMRFKMSLETGEVTVTGADVERVPEEAEEPDDTPAET